MKAATSGRRETSDKSITNSERDFWQEHEKQWQETLDLFSQAKNFVEPLKRYFDIAERANNNGLNFEENDQEVISKVAEHEFKEEGL